AGEGAYRGGGGIGAVLREGASADHEDVADVPRLQILVDRARRRVRAHDRAADVVRALVGHDVVVAVLPVGVHPRRVHGPRDLLGLLRDPVYGFALVLAPV